MIRRRKQDSDARVATNRVSLFTTRCQQETMKHDPGSLTMNQVTKDRKCHFTVIQVGSLTIYSWKIWLNQWHAKLFSLCYWICISICKAFFPFKHSWCKIYMTLPDMCTSIWLHSPCIKNIKLAWIVLLILHEDYWLKCIGMKNIIQNIKFIVSR